MTPKNSTHDVLIAGAGIVGVASALWAQQRGLSVALADQNDPGSGASFGNAGAIATYGCVPVNNPALLRELPSLLASKSAPLRIDWLYAARNLPWMLSFLRNCTPERVARITGALAELLARTEAGLSPLVEAAGAEDLFVSNDFIYAWQTEKAYQASHASTTRRERHGVQMERLTGHDIAALEPGVAMTFHSGVRFTGGRHVVNPQALVTRLFDRFIADGGTYLNSNVASVTPQHTNVQAELQNGDVIAAKQLVVAAGAHSRSIRGSGAEDLPLGVERGYHVMFADHAHRVTRPVAWAEGAFYATPMDHGLRLAGTVELDDLDAPSNPARTQALTNRARIMFGEEIGEPTSTWLGLRPTMPDSLPVIGQSHRSDRILFAFGHQHLGLTLGGITGRVIADLAQNRTPNFDISAYAPNRFGTRRR